MTRLPVFARLGRRIARFCKREDGSATIEFVLTLPVVMLIFTLAFESGLYMIRYIMLDRAVDQTVRDLRLGRFVNTPPDQIHDVLKTKICDRTVMIQDCDTSLRLELASVSTTTWNVPSAAVACVDRDKNVKVSLEQNPGVANEFMIVRVCVMQDPLFPGSDFAQKIAVKSDSQGGYALRTVSGFVNEP